jgi:hypothetical protein
MPTREQIGAAASDGYATAEVLAEHLADVSNAASVPAPLPAAPEVAELTSCAPCAEKDGFVLFVVIGINEVPLPAASFRISTSPAFDADEFSGSHGQDDAASRRSRKVAKGVMSDQASFQPRTRPISKCSQGSEPSLTASLSGVARKFAHILARHTRS